MTLSAGDKLGPYEILVPIGAGGMGEVYRARDPRLGRDVAIKVSAERFSERFEREARAIASLNHPNICTLHDVGPNYLVMELVEGETLAERIKQGPMPLAEALPIARQIADALDAAHEKGIVHRDLKPGNIKIKPDGTVKVLDFGLAKQSRDREGAVTENSPTLTLDATQAGMILGTASYMAPEQAKGKPVDKRADIYAFGAVLYEMVTGKRLHQGETTTEVLASVLKEEPRWDSVPPQVRRLLHLCLEKDPQKRLRHIGDVMTLVDDAPAPNAPVRRPRWFWPAVAGAVIAAGVALVLWAPWKKSAPTQAVRFEVGPADKMTFIAQAAMAVSPDGRWMVFTAQGEDGVARYFLRSLDGVEVRPLPGTEGGTAPAASWSFDSRWVLFSNNLGNSKLKKVDIQGGPPQSIADYPGNLEGAGWNSDGVIIAGATNSPILRVPASGGQMTPITALAPGESTHLWPQFLPDGKHFLYLRVSSDASKTGVYIGSIDAQPNRQSIQRLLATDRQAYYAPSPGGGTGHLIFMRQTTLMAQPFDPNKMTLSAEPAAIADGVDSYSGTNHGLFSVSDTGTLVYRGGSGTQTMLTWYDQQGNPAGTLDDPGDYAFPAISPDGGRVAVAMGPQASRDIWILDVARGSSTRFTFDPARDDYPAWSPDGKNIAFSSNRGGQMDLYIKPSDGSGEEKLLLHTDEPKDVERFTKDGRFLLFTSIGPKTADDLWALPFPTLSQSSQAKPVSLLQTQFREFTARASPDGRWLAYLSTESGAAEIYVRPFTPEAPAGTGAKFMVSKGGGIRPLWRPDGKGLFYVTLPFQVMAVDIDTSKGFQAGTPRRIFTAPPTTTTSSWDLSPDGKRFLFVAPPSAGRVIPFTVIVNWAASLKK
jgi:eukaryotic-like serine/threonine-protein kinase